MPKSHGTSPLPALLLLALAGVPCGAQQAPAPQALAWSLHTQATWIDQYHPDFNSPYEGPNSLTAAAQAERTFSYSLFAGLRLPSCFDLYFNPEVFQGHGLSETLGVAGYPNGEAVKAAFPTLHYNTSRVYIQRSFDLSGDPQDVADAANQIAGKVAAEHLTFSLGKFAASDFFDDNAYSKDERTQFMNWSLWESASWDYPADVVGYTAGFVAEWFTPGWALHYGIFMEPTVSNGQSLDPHLLLAHGQILQFDRGYQVGAQSGNLRPFIFWNKARMGDYQDALDSPSGDLIATRAYRSKAGFGLSWDQTLADGLGAFSRLSWDDGRTESFTFTEIDRSAALGLSLSGAHWGRKDDVLAAAGVVNAIAGSHQAYLASGGTEGLILGDGALSYGPEEIVEVYYSLRATAWLWLSPDFQYIAHPGYNRARGPVPVVALRAHVAL